MECTINTFGATARIINRDVQQTSLQLLKDVELTVDVLVHAQDTMADFVILITNTVESIKSCEKTTPIDDEDVVCDLLETSEGILHNSLSSLNEKIELAKADDQLQAEHQDAIVDEYSRLINQIRLLHGSLSEMRWAIMEHDATVDEDLSETFENVTDLMKSLHA